MSMRHRASSSLTMDANQSAVQMVQIDGLVVLKIIKHHHEEQVQGNDVVQGVLLGLVQDHRLEITNCFPFPKLGENEDFGLEDYQMDMMRNLRQVNVDHMHVGWYQSAAASTFINRDFMDSQFNYQHSICDSVALIYDPNKSTRGQISLRAFRLSPHLMHIIRHEENQPEVFKQLKVSFDSMMTEIPVVMRNSHLVNSLFCEFEEQLPSSNRFDGLDLSMGVSLERQLKFMMIGVDEMITETAKMAHHQKQVGRAAQIQAQNKARLNELNAARASRGESAVTDDNSLEKNRVPRVGQAPPRLESLLASAQLAQYCTETAEMAGQTIGKLMVADGVQGHAEGPAFGSDSSTSAPVAGKSD